MKMLMIICRDSIEEDVLALLNRHKVRAFTEVRDVSGTGEAGPAFHSLSWPAQNNMIFVALHDQDAARIVAALKEFRDERDNKKRDIKFPLRVFTLPCELAV